MSAGFGQAFVGELDKEDRVGLPDVPIFGVSASILSLQTRQVVGVLVNHVAGDEMNSILSGQMQIQLGAQTGGEGRGETLEIYLVNRDKLMATPSRFVLDAVLRQKVETEPVGRCLDQGEEMTGRYRDYWGIDVFGASMCPKGQWWILLAEIDEGEVMAVFKKLKTGIAIATLLAGLFIILVVVILSRVVQRRTQGILDVLREIERGNLESRIPVSARDEVDRIGEGVNRMAAQIEQRTGELKSAKEKFRSLFETSRDAIMTLEPPSWRFTSGNPATVRMFGAKDEADFISYGPWQLSPERQPDGRPSGEKAKEMIETAMRDGFHLFEWTHRRIGGEDFFADVLLTRMEREGKAMLQATVRDITERKQKELEHARVEEQLRASQKLESIGSLAGGIAHDFNNLLGIINGYSKLTLSGLKDDDPSRGNLMKEIQEAGERAAALTHQLLAFSRRQVLQSKVINLNEIVVGTEKMLRRLIGEDINLTTFSEPGLGRVKADPSQMEQVIMNLAVNARDAMPQGGKLTLEIKNVVLDKENTDWASDVDAGRYVMMAISDTGIGMDAKTRGQIFEPFFTTKEKGKGTGLGLSTVYGIVKQSGGHLSVYSEPGHGTSVKIYLPRVDDKAELSVSPNVPIGSLEGTETILVVEDEDRLRKLVCRVLREKGYTILHAPSGQEALRISKSHKGPIPLLLTDVIMPGLSGRETADKLSSERPGIKILYMSGYTDDAIVRHGVLEEGVQFLPKPFAPEALARKVREVIES